MTPMVVRGCAVVTWGFWSLQLVVAPHDPALKAAVLTGFVAGLCPSSWLPVTGPLQLGAWLFLLATLPVARSVDGVFGHVCFAVSAAVFVAAWLRDRTPPNALPSSSSSTSSGSSSSSSSASSSAAASTSSSGSSVAVPARGER